jgi:ABC-type nitrate/sulfonate/bicarbonate transport system ATPase subunit
MSKGIRIIHLNKSFDSRPIILDLNLDLPESGIIALSGPSGCGKTTLLHLLAGVLRPDSGSIEGLAPNRISMVFQEDRLLPWLSAAENIALVLADSGQACLWLDRMQLADWADHYPAELSGGMRRRIALARALAFASDLLLLDEPFLGMDAELKQSLDALIRETARIRPVLLVTHDLSDIERLADLVLLAEGPPLRLNRARS